MGIHRRCGGCCVSDAKRLRMMDYQRRVIVECDDGALYPLLLSVLGRVAADKLPLSEIPEPALRSIIAQWMHFIPIIEEFADE